MRAFTYERAHDPVAAARAVAGRPGARFIAGGTNLLDLMKLEVETPTHLVDVQDLAFDKIEDTPEGGLRIGALVTNTNLATDERVRRNYAVLSRSIVAGASGQLRNKASTAGNLLQRTRCSYFYNPNMPCNKREPGAGCAAIGGASRQLGVIGVSGSCIATFPGDMAVAMRVLDAVIETVGADGQRRAIPIADFHRLWGDRPQDDTTLRPGELITAVTLPAPLGGRHFYEKVREMALEIAMDEMAEKLGLDPIEFRAKNDTQVDPQDTKHHFSQRQLVRCLTEGAQRFGWSRRNGTPGQMRDGRWLVGMGMASAFRNHMNMPSGARVRLGRDGLVTVETDMTDIGTGSYTIIAQTAAEMMGLPTERVVVRLGDSAFPVSAGSGGQFGAANATAGVYAACVKLREAVANRLGFNSADAMFADGMVRSGNRSVDLKDAASGGELVGEDKIEFGSLDETNNTKSL